ncbi:MAG: hypothetical protein ACPLRU_06365, partial [Desulfofundulus sp.]
PLRQDLSGRTASMLRAAEAALWLPGVAEGESNSGPNLEANELFPAGTGWRLLTLEANSKGFK